MREITATHQSVIRFFRGLNNSEETGRPPLRNREVNCRYWLCYSLLARSGHVASEISAIVAIGPARQRAPGFSAKAWPRNPKPRVAAGRTKSIRPRLDGMQENCGRRRQEVPPVTPAVIAAAPPNPIPQRGCIRRSLAEPPPRKPWRRGALTRGIAAIARSEMVASAVK